MLYYRILTLFIKRCRTDIIEDIHLRNVLSRGLLGKHSLYKIQEFPKAQNLLTRNYFQLKDSKIIPKFWRFLKIPENSWKFQENPGGPMAPKLEKSWGITAVRGHHRSPMVIPCAEMGVRRRPFAAQKSQENSWWEPFDPCLRAKRDIDPNPAMNPVKRL